VLAGRPAGAGLWGLEVCDEGFLVAIVECCRVEGGGLAVENALRQLEHVRRNWQSRNVRKVILRVADLAQRRAQEPLLVGLQRNDALPLCQHEPAERHHALAPHGVANDRKRLHSDRIVRGDIIRPVEEALIDARTGQPQAPRARAQGIPRLSIHTDLTWQDGL
jgi:hypothetical protein